MPSQPAAPLLCVTPSPAVDRTARVARLSMGRVLRPTQVVALPGGKGVNAARAARRLGARVVTTGMAGGHAGRWMVEALEREGLSPRFSPAAAEARTTYVTVDEAGRSLLVYEPSSSASADEFAAFLALLERELLPGASRVIVAGSLPAGLAPGCYALIVEACRRGGRPVLVDTWGAGLLAALAARPEIVKIGLAEARDTGVAGHRAPARSAAEALVGRGAGLAVVTDGARPVAASDGRTTWLLEVPRLEAVNAVGSGDAFNAGLSLALAQGRSIEEALVRGVAAGSANALSLGAGMLDPDRARALVGEVVMRTVAAR